MSEAGQEKCSHKAHEQADIAMLTTRQMKLDAAATPGKHSISMCGFLLLMAVNTLLISCAWSIPEVLRPSNGLGPTVPLVGSHDNADAAKFYIADVPAKYVQGVTGRGTDETNAQYGFASLGGLLSPKYDHWDTKWHQIDAWYNNQMAVSPLRTYNVDEADIVYVPVMMNVQSHDDMNSFIENAHSIFPYLGQKPHLLVLSHAAEIYNNRSHLLTHKNSRMFMFLSFAQHDPQLARSDNATDLSHVLGCPQFSHVHWSQGSWQLHAVDRNIPDQEAELFKTKSTFSVESFAVRHYADRFAVFEDCQQRNDLCTHLDYSTPGDAVPVYEAYQAAWYVLHPRADFIARSAWFDTILADSIPVVFRPDYVKALPFADILDYDRLMVLIPEEAFLGPERHNIVEILWKRFSHEEAVKKIRYIHSVRHVFQYMLNPRHELVSWSQRSNMHPKDDAFTFTLKSVLRKVCQDGTLPARCHA